MSKRNKKYGLGKFCLDFFLVVVTGGLYGVYLVFKFLRTR